RVTVRVVLAHDLTDDPGGLHVAAFRAQAHLAHRVEDPAMHRLEAVAGIGQGPCVDDRVAVLEEGVAHLVRHVDVLDALGDVGAGCGCGTAGHAGSGLLVGWASDPPILTRPLPGSRLRHTPGPDEWAHGRIGDMTELPPGYPVL